MGKDKSQRDILGRFVKGIVPWNKDPIIKNCLTCNKQFEVRKSRASERRGKFCSMKCRRKYKFRLAKNFVINEDIAELIGVIIGNGCINKVSNRETYRRNDYRIQISGNRIEDKEYYEGYLPKLIYRILKIKPKPYLSKNGAYIIQFQSEPFRIFLHTLGIKSPKAKTAHIPDCILRNEKDLRACIRGIADADFTFIGTNGKAGKNSYPRISAHFASKRLVQDLEKSLRKMGFTLSCIFDYERYDKRTGTRGITNYINLDGPHNVKRWFALIGFSNMRILTRYYVWKRYNSLKPKTTIMERRRLLMG